MEIKQLEKIVESAKQAISARRRLAQFAESSTTCDSKKFS